MASNGYIIFIITAKVRMKRGDDTLPLDNLDGNGRSLLFDTARAVHRLTSSGVQTIDRFEAAYEFTKWEGAGLTLLVEGALGGYGTPGNTVNIDTSTRRPYTDRDANMSDARALLALAPDAQEAVLVCERRGGRHLKNAIEQAVFRPIAKRLGLTINVDAHVDLDAWTRYLDHAKPFKVSAVWPSTRREDLRPDSRKVAELKMIAEGGMAERVGKAALTAARKKATKRTQEAIRIRELTPPDREHYGEPHYEIAVTDADGTQRTVRIEREQLPQWVYPTDGRRMPRSTMRQVFAEHAGRILVSESGATLPEEWASKAWTRQTQEWVRTQDDEEAGLGSAGA